MPEDHDIAGIATEGRDVGAHPLQPRHQVLDAIGSRAMPALAAQLRMRQEAIGTEAVREAGKRDALEDRDVAFRNAADFAPR